MMILTTCGDSITHLFPHRSFLVGASYNAPVGADMCLSPMAHEPNLKQPPTQPLSVSLVTVLLITTQLYIIYY